MQWENLLVLALVSLSSVLVHPTTTSLDWLLLLV